MSAQVKELQQPRQLGQFKPKDLAHRETAISEGSTAVGFQVTGQSLSGAGGFGHVNAFNSH